MRTSMNRASRAITPGRQPALAGLLLVVGLGTALIVGGCGGHNSPTTQNANNPGSSQTTGVQNGGPATGGNSSSAGNSLQNLNNSINSSASSLNNDQNDANSSASQSQEGEQQP